MFEKSFPGLQAINPNKPAEFVTWMDFGYQIVTVKREAVSISPT